MALILSGEFKEFDTNYIPYSDNKYTIYFRYFHFYSNSWLKPEFFKNENKIGIRYKDYGGGEYSKYFDEDANPLYRIRNSKYIRYISIEDLQTALNNYLGYERKIIDTDIYPHYFGGLTLICEENDMTKKIDSLEEKIEELEEEIEKIKEEKKELSENIENMIYSAKNELFKELYWKSEEIIKFLEKENDAD